MQEQNEQVEEKQLTPEEYAAARSKATEHLKKEIEYAKVEKEYENLVADVEEAKTRGITAIATRARFFAQQNVEAQQGGEKTATPPSSKPPVPKPRKLKKD